MVALLFAKDNKVEVLEQAVEHFQAQQGEYVLEFEARLEGMFQKQKMGAFKTGRTSPPGDDTEL